ncbi:hypothetical protein BDZ91DRAFT_799453 [Kalaharituber pfeilii]|nr:hypothetical protein BDZ91DRAFT_799453 [Kalaharituber pfeilii]
MELWKKFHVPQPQGGRTGIAMTSKHADIFIALYTILIGFIFILAWNILVSLIILFAAPKKMTRTTYIAAVATWNSGDPFNTSRLMIEHAARVLRGILCKQHTLELTWEAFGFDMAILFAAVGTLAGNLALGLLFPYMLVLKGANFAPVNPHIVYYPQWESMMDPAELLRITRGYDSVGALRAGGSVDASENAIFQQRLVAIQKRSAPPYDGESRYELHYSYTVAGFEMGLQYLSDLSLHVNGSCNFQGAWYSNTKLLENSDGSVTQWEIYSMWKDVESYPSVSRVNSAPSYAPVYPRTPPSALFSTVIYSNDSINQETGRSYFTILPLTASRPAVTQNDDPWYATRDGTDEYLLKKYKYETKVARPPMMCIQDDSWAYGAWKGTLSKLFSNEDDGPGITVPRGIQKILGPSFAYPMVVTIGRTLGGAAIESATHVLHGDNAVDAEECTADADFTRLLHTSYLATRDLFRIAALAGVARSQERNERLYPGKNSLRADDGGLLPLRALRGVGDFVVFSSQVRALRLGYLIAVPTILLLLTAVSALLAIERKLTSSNSLGRFSRYHMLETGLRAVQLYRMVDQLLAERAPDSHPHRQQAHWKGQDGELPFVVGNPNPGDGPTFAPDFQVQVQGEDRRLILDIQRQGELGWRTLEAADGSVPMRKVSRQKQAEAAAGLRPCNETMQSDHPSSTEDIEKGATSERHELARASELDYVPGHSLLARATE